MVGEVLDYKLILFKSRLKCSRGKFQIKMSYKYDLIVLTNFSKNSALFVNSANKFSLK